MGFGIGFVKVFIIGLHFSRLEVLFHCQELVTTHFRHYFLSPSDLFGGLSFCSLTFRGISLSLCMQLLRLVVFLSKVPLSVIVRPSFSILLFISERLTSN